MSNCFLHSKLLSLHGVTGIFSLRHGGISLPPFDSLNLGSGLGDDEKHVMRNLNILTNAADIPHIVHRVIQVHGTNVFICRGRGCMHQNQADILIGIGDAAVAVRVADCVPILLADVEAGIVAAVHAGWRGTAAQAVRHAVTVMQQHGAKQERMFACIGPCIGLCCFEINAATAHELSQHGNDVRRFIHYAADRIHADLAGINAQQLQSTGIPHTHIEQMSACTCCDESRFYSWRRDGKQAGRHLAVVALPKVS